MRRLQILTLLVALLGISCYAQHSDVYPGTPQRVVMVEYFNPGYGIRSQDYQFVDYLRSKAMSGAESSKRVKVLSAEDNLELRVDDSRNYQTAADYARHRYEVMQNLGANYSLECDIHSINAIPPKKKDESWKGEISCVFRLVDTNNGSVVARTTIEPKYSVRTASSPEEAIRLSCNSVETNVKTFILDNVMITGQILDIASLKKADEAKEVYINLGPENGAFNGAKFQVFEIAEIAGREMSKKIGEVKISENKGAQISLAKITKGGKDIKTQIDNGVVLKLVSNQSGFWDGF